MEENNKEINEELNEKTNKENEGSNDNLETNFNNENLKNKNPMIKYFFIIVLMVVLTPLIHFSTTKLLYKLVEDIPNEKIYERNNIENTEEIENNLIENTKDVENE